MPDPVLVALNADIVNYSRLVADDPQHTADALSSARSIVEHEIAAAGGSLLNFVGDNFMATFDRPDQAVHAAIVITNAVAADGSNTPEHLRLRFRMGIDMGPIHIGDDGTHLGDALNVAARIQSIAPPGGFAVSGEIFGVLDEPGFRFRSTGKQRLKNIPEQIDVYDFVDLPADGISSTIQASPLGLETPRVAVLPMHIKGGTDELTQLGAFILADVVSGLIGLHNLDVVDVTNTEGQPSGADPAPPNVRYMLLSGLTQLGSRVRAWAQVREVVSQSVLWAAKWDSDTDSLFDLSDTFTADVVRAFEVELIIGEPARFYQELGSPEAVAKVYEGWYNLTASTRNGWNRANTLFGELRQDAPNIAVGPVLYAFTQWMGARDGLVEDRGEALERSRVNAQRGVELGDATGLSSMILAALDLESGDASAALEGITEAKVLRPTCDLTWAMEASIRRYLGQWEQAVALIDQAMGLSPVTKPWYPTVLASSYYVGGQYQQAAAVAEEVIEHQPRNIEALLVLAASQNHLGLERRARATGAMIVERFPGANSAEWLSSKPYQDTQFVDRWRQDLEHLGLLEG